MFKDYPIFLHCISRIFLQFGQLKSKNLNLKTNSIFIDLFLQFFKAVKESLHCLDFIHLIVNISACIGNLLKVDIFREDPQKFETNLK